MAKACELVKAQKGPSLGYSLHKLPTCHGFGIFADVSNLLKLASKLHPRILTPPWIQHITVSLSSPNGTTLAPA